MSKSAREIKLTDGYIKSDNFSLKVGAVEQRDFPDTIYLFCSFWVEPKPEYKTLAQVELKEELDRQLTSIYKKDVRDLIKGSEIFPLFNENIFIVNIPDNLNYNEGRNFISMEFYLHTKNINDSDKLALNTKKDTRLFNKILEVANKIAESEIMTNNTHFNLYKSSK